MTYHVFTFLRFLGEISYHKCQLNKCLKQRDFFSVFLFFLLTKSGIRIAMNYFACGTKLQTESQNLFYHLYTFRSEIYLIKMIGKGSWRF